MKKNDYIKKLKELGACDEAIKYLLNFDTSQEAWDNCNRGDWMLWLIGKMSGKNESDKRKKLTLTTCKCARLSLKYVKKGELRPLKAIEIATAWANNDQTILVQAIKKAAYAAYAAAGGAAYAAAATAYAAADDVANIAAAAAYAADGVATADDADDAAVAVKKETLAKCARIVRIDFPNIGLILKG